MQYYYHKIIIVIIIIIIVYYVYNMYNIVIQMCITFA